MPCGIYHDDMVYDQIDQYVETMYKAISELDHLKFNSPKDRNQYVRWIMMKEKSSDDMAHLMLTYFLQQKIKPGEEDTAKRVVSAHKLLFLMVSIKQNVDIRCVNQFKDEWENFKLLFHREGYECEMKRRTFEKEEALEKKRSSPQPNQ